MRTRHSCLVLLALGVASVLIACAGSQTSLGASKSAVPHWNAWLCFPGSATDWCNVVLATKIVGANGSVKNLTVPVAADPRVDCFYLYPTVSQQHRGNSTLAVGAAERTIAIVQAAEFSRVCRVFAPMYRQVTVSAGTCVAGRCIPQGKGAYEYDDVLAAWRDYMARYNDGRGVILIGHSEGSYLFQDLLQNVIERSAERKQIVSAILLGGDVTVDAHDRFDGVPACASTTETGCIVAYSSWSHALPADAMFQQVSSPSQHVLCVNPAAPGSSGSAPITPIFVGQLPEGIVPLPSVYDHDLFVVFPDLYTARCVQHGTRAWLLVTRIHHPGDRRPTVQQVLAPNWGLHAADVNIALANLISLVGSESRAWLKQR
jgi:hypothetical protein